MKLSHQLFLGLSLFFSSQSLNAQQAEPAQMKTGSDLQAVCSSRQVSYELVCHAWIKGFLAGATFTAFQGPHGYCVPAPWTTSQIAEVLVTHIKHHPEEHSDPAFLVMRRALSHSYPCETP